LKPSFLPKTHFERNVPGRKRIEGGKRGGSESSDRRGSRRIMDTKVGKVRLMKVSRYVIQEERLSEDKTIYIFFFLF